MGLSLQTECDADFNDMAAAVLTAIQIDVELTADMVDQLTPDGRNSYVKKIADLITEVCT